MNQLMRMTGKCLRRHGESRSSSGHVKLMMTLILGPQDISCNNQEY